MVSILNDVLTFLLLYGKCAFVTFVVFALSELFMIITKPDYYPWVKSVLGQPKEQTTWKSALFFYATWPIFALMMLRAFFKGQTFVQHTCLSILKKRKKKADFDRKVGERIVAIKKAEPMWRTLQAPNDTPMYVLSYVLDGQEILTHLIVDYNNLFVCVRAMDDSSKCLPWMTASSIEEAKDDCVKDYEWSALCTPGLEALRQAVWKNLHAKMTDGLKRFDR